VCGREKDFFSVEYVAERKIFFFVLVRCREKKYVYSSVRLLALGFGWKTVGGSAKLRTHCGIKYFFLRVGLVVRKKSNF